MTHDNTSAVMSKFKGIGAKKVKDSQNSLCSHSIMTSRKPG